ncbi:MAG TPA: hypothetical protein DER01_00690 [Phycisphaerales bacterium]|nr:hypothetical protein [Phycisphaerales bacterium]
MNDKAIITKVPGLNLGELLKQSPSVLVILFAMWWQLGEVEDKLNDIEMVVIYGVDPAMILQGRASHLQRIEDSTWDTPIKSNATLPSSSPIKAGDTCPLPGQHQQRGYHSPSLPRRFEKTELRRLSLNPSPGRLTGLSQGVNCLVLPGKSFATARGSPTGQRYQ